MESVASPAQECGLSSSVLHENLSIFAVERLAINVHTMLYPLFIVSSCSELVEDT